MQQVVKSCEILEEVENEVGSLDFDGLFLKQRQECLVTH